MRETAMRDGRISICVPCYNRARYLNRFLHSLTWSRVPFDHYEVVVVNDGGTDNVDAVVNAWKQEGMIVLLIHARQSGPPRNCGPARNIGIRVAKNPIFITTDPEMIFATDVLSLAQEKLEKGVFCSPAQCFGLTEKAQARINNELNWKNLTGADYIRMSRDGWNWAQRPGRARALHSAFICRRADLERIRGYDEQFTEWGYEDDDMILRLKKGLELKRVFIQGAVVVHQWHPGPHGRTGIERILTAADQISDSAWQIYYQKAVSRKFTKPVKNAGDWGKVHASSSKTQRFHPDKLDEMMTAKERSRFAAAWKAAASEEHDKAQKLMPQKFATIFDALYLLTLDLKSVREFSKASRLSRFALSRPWEMPQGEVRWDRWKSQQIEELRSEFKVAALLYPNFTNLLAELVSIENEAGHGEESERLLSVMEAELGADTPPSCFQRAIAAYRQTDHLSARMCIIKAISKNPKPEYHALDCELALAAGGKEETLERLISTFKSNNVNLKDDPLLFALPYALDCAKDLPNDIASNLDKLLDEWPELPFNVAEECIRQGFDLLAISLLRKFMKNERPPLGMANRVARFHLASALKRIGSAGEALELFESIMAKDHYKYYETPFQAAVNFHYGELLLQEGKKEGALQNFKTCLQLNPNHSKASQYVVQLSDAK